jgi:16S rRNA (uracil1498-N3)-methyltransferase
MADRFYVDCALAPGRVELTGPEAHHLATVCRLRPGDAVCLFNGDGREYPAAVLEVGRRTVAVQINGVAAPPREIGHRVEVAAPLPKGDRAQFLVEKLTELGATAFVPLQTSRSVVQPGEAKLEKLQRHVIEASKQCGRNLLMQVEPPISWPAYCARADLPALRILAHPGGSGDPWPAHGDVTLAVGPEGGFTQDEIDSASAAGWKQVDLGPRILRVETAAIVLATASVVRG